VQQRLVMTLILGCFAGQRYSGNRIKLRGPTPDICHALEEGVRTLIRETRASVVILGCTDIPLALTEGVFKGTLMVDSVRSLAETPVRPSFRVPEPASTRQQAGDAPKRYAGTHMSFTIQILVGLIGGLGAGIATGGSG
jgi:hypothetical protein